MNERRVAATVTKLVEALVGEVDLAEFLDGVTLQAVELLNVAAAGILLRTDGGSRLLPVTASTESGALRLVLDRQTHDGPAWQAYHSAQPVSVVGTRRLRARWPRLAEAAEQGGFRAIHAAPMGVRGQPLGVLVLLRYQAAPLAAGKQRLAETLAGLATVGVLGEHVPHDPRLIADQLAETLHHRVLVEQAIGVLVYQFGATPDEAFAMLRTQAMDQQRSLIQAARAVLNWATDFERRYEQLGPLDPPGREHGVRSLEYG
jgi:GAF domain-containing protein